MERANYVMEGFGLEKPCATSRPGSSYGSGTRRFAASDARS